MKASEHDGRTQSQRLASFLLSYRSTPHSTTHETPSELFLKRKLRTRLDLLKPDVNKSVCLEQAKQKNNHDCRCQTREYFVGQNVQAHNFRSGPRWAPGVIVERLGPLTYLVQVDSGIFWQRHIDHLLPAEDKPLDQNTKAPLSPDLPLPTQSDFIPVSDNEHSEQLPNVEQRANQPPSERRYPRRLNRRPPARYTS